jgi:hypothetical protein
MQKMTMSWEAPGSLSSPRFFFNYEFINYISTWCISWVFVISLNASPPNASPGILWSRSLHHHLMHLLGFCDYIHCITTWCISWEDFVISLIASSLDAPLGILWFRSLHHHLMHLLTNCITHDASPKFLWSHWLHHHLMYLPTCGDFSTPLQMQRWGGKGQQGIKHLDRLLAKRNHTSDASWKFLCMFIQFVNGHSIDDSELP